MDALTVDVLNGTPVTFVWRRNRIQIEQITDHWSESGRWWDGEAACEFFQVFTQRGMFLLCKRLTDEHWYAKPVQ
jgi:hypothetical protein